MTVLIYCILALGAIEIISNLFHFSKGSKTAIGLSAKRQHQELSSQLNEYHFYLKAIIMFAFGLLMLLGSISALVFELQFPLLMVVAMFATYGLVQAIYYIKPYKVWLSLIVYLLPLIAFLLLTNDAHADTVEAIDTSHALNFVIPISLSIEPIKHLIVVDYDNDSEYISIEPQIFDDPIYGNGIRVLLYRKDKLVDVYYQKSLKFDSTKFCIGEGLGEVGQVEMSPAKFEISSKGVDLDIAFTDNKKRLISMKIIESTTSDSRFSFLAPVGKDIKSPNKLFLAYMHDFDFVRKNGTQIHTRIGDRLLKPASFPLTRDWHKVYFARYASRLTIGQINESPFIPLTKTLKVGVNTFGDTTIIINKKFGVEEYLVGDKTRNVSLVFEDAFPNLLAMQSGSQIIGKWKYKADDVVLTGGQYKVERKDSIFRVILDVTDKWKPKELPFSFKIFTLIECSFRTWTTTYFWEATLNIATNEVVSNWRRKE